MATGRKTGGRKAGTPNKAKAARADATRLAGLQATADMTPEQIAALTPLQIMEKAATVLALAGNWAGAAVVAKEIAPYRHAKLQPMAQEKPPEADELRARRIHDMVVAMRGTVGGDPDAAVDAP